MSLILLISRAICGNAYAADLPKDLEAISRQIPCSDISKFYDRPGEVDPPYLYGYLPGPKKDSAAFWCQADTQYYLVTVGRNVMTDANKCPRSFEWWNVPGGLSLSTKKHIPLDEFAGVNDPHRKGPAGRTTNYAPLRDYYDGYETLFYCYNGEWLYRIRD